MISFKTIALIVVPSITIGSVVAILVGTPNNAHRSKPSTVLGTSAKHSSNTVLSLAPLPVCGQGQGPLGFIASVTSSNANKALASSGFRVSALVSADSEGPTALLAISAPANSTSSEATLVSTISQVTSVTVSDPVYPVSKEGALRSCNYLLTDIPSAQPYITSAVAELVKAGYLTQAQADARIAEYISDDPIAASDLIVTIDTQGPEQTLPNVPSGTHLYGTNSFAVVLSRHSAQAVAVGPVPW